MAEPPSFLWRAPEDGIGGSTAGRFERPRGIAVDPATGHIYVSERSSNRVSEFTAWGEFVKAWGWGVATGASQLQTCGPAATPPTGTCQAGSEGEKAGQFDEPEAVAVDGNGDVYVGDLVNHRVQKFDSDGKFLLMFGGDVNQTKVEGGGTVAEKNLCTAASGDVCRAGTTGTGQGQFSEWSSAPTLTGAGFIAVGPDETVYVGDKDRIQEFNPNGTFKGQLALPEPGFVRSIAVDPTNGDLYMIYNQNFTEEVSDKPFIYRHTSSGWEPFTEVGKPASGEVPKINGFPKALATSPQGNLYVVARQTQSGNIPWHEVVAFDSEGNCLEGLCPAEKFAKPAVLDSMNVLAVSQSCGMDEEAIYLTFSEILSNKRYVDAYSEPPDPGLCPPQVSAPAITDQFANSVEEDGASLRAKINSRFWTTTTYYVEYGTEACSLGGCAKQPLPPGQALNSKTNFPVLTEPIQLGGLEPETTYHFRFVAKTVFEPGPGGEAEVKGEGGTPGLDGSEGQFTTLPEGGEEAEICENAAFRTEASALLPDCRAYEMVSPVEKGGGDALLLGKEARENQVMQSSVDGNRMTYATYRAFAEPEGGPNTSQYIATRGESGWSSKSIALQRGIRVIAVLETSRSEYTAFSPDLCQGWLRHDTDHPAFAPGAIEGFPNLYSRTTCEAPPAYDALTGVESPITEPNTNPVNFLPELQGLSTDGVCAVFRANGRLTPDASEATIPAGGIYQLYEDCGAGPELVSVLPEGEASDAASTAASQGEKSDNRSYNLEDAVSEDAERIYWSSGGKLYVREHARQEQSAIAAGKCTEAAKACTFPVSETVSPNASTFWAASPSGSIAFFTVNGTLQRFNFATKKSLQIAGEVQGVLGASEDVTRVYLVSKEDKDGGGKATAGQLNVYRYEGGSLTYVTTLVAQDLAPGPKVPYPLSPLPLLHSARVTPDGKVLAFESRAEITGFDNRESESGKPASEVFLYSLDTGEVVCASCNRGNARPLGRDIRPGVEEVFASALLPTWQTQLLPGHPLSDDGARLFFESYDRLVPRDENGMLDVYEWEAAGTGGCEEEDTAFNPEAGGCVYLISTGASDRDSVFLDASPSGDDVFIGTAQSLLVQDPSKLDVYDARVLGGYPPPATPAIPCDTPEGPPCREEVATPAGPAAPPSQGGGDNPPSALKCGPGMKKVTRKGKPVCKPKKAKHKKKKHAKAKKHNKRSANRGAGR